MLQSPFFLNPVREGEYSKRSFIHTIYYFVRRQLCWLGTFLGFLNIDYTYVHGDKKRIHLGKNCSTMNSIFNVISGEIFIDNDTLLGHNCMLLTGTHLFKDGKRVSLHAGSGLQETPTEGRDIRIGSGCFIGSGVTIVGPITIGNNVVIAAGAVVTKSLPDGCFAAGVPARVIKSL